MFALKGKSINNSTKEIYKVYRKGNGCSRKYKCNALLTFCFIFFMVIVTKIFQVYFKGEWKVNLEILRFTKFDMSVVYVFLVHKGNLTE